MQQFDNSSPPIINQGLVNQPQTDAPIQPPVQPQPQPQPQPQLSHPPQQNLLQAPLQYNQPQQQGLEHAALQGGNNKQQISNFMSALNQSGAGSNNSFMHSQNPNFSQYQNLIDPNIVNQNNGNTPNITTQVSNSTNPNLPNSANIYPTSSTPTTSIAQPQHTPIGSDPSYSSYVPNQPFLNNLPTPSNPSYSYASSQPFANFSPTTIQPSSQVTQSTEASKSQYVPVQPFTPVPTTAPSPAPAPSTYNGLSTSPSFINQLVSDETKKTDITPANHQIQDFLSTIQAHNYEYKDKQDGIGVFTSPMAQELEQTELGKQAVINTPRGKMVDYARLGGVNLAASAVLYREQQKLQKQVDQLRKAFRIK